MPVNPCARGSPLRTVVRADREIRLRHRVVISEPVLQAAPEYVRAEARVRFEEIAEAMKDVPESSAFWESVSTSRLCLLVHGWTFFYTFERGTLRVTDACK